MRLEARALSCSRGDRRLFENISFILEANQLLLVEGRNGSGKTSLLRILCGMRTQDDGSVLWCGESIERLGTAYYEQLAYVGHQDGVKRDLTVTENLRLAQILGGASKTTVQDAIEAVNLCGFEDEWCYALSAGQRRRVALARLVLVASPLWILDEPLTALDRQSIDIFRLLMQNHLDAGGMIVLTSHQDPEMTSSQVQRLRL